MATVRAMVIQRKCHFLRISTAVDWAQFEDIKNILWDREILPQGGFYSYSRPTGGNVQIVLGADVIFPLPFVKDQRSLQSSFFIDAGNIFNTKCGSSQINCFNIEEGELRYSVGVGATWLSGFGPITFSIAKPLNSQPGDETEVFQFSLGNQF